MNMTTNQKLQKNQSQKKRHQKEMKTFGEPYIIHPVAVASILGSLHLDAAAISAGLLHDVLEDTEIDGDLLREEFGEEVFIVGIH